MAYENERTVEFDVQVNSWKSKIFSPKPRPWTSLTVPRMAFANEKKNLFYFIYYGCSFILFIIAVFIKKIGEQKIRRIHHFLTVFGVRPVKICQFRHFTKGVWMPSCHLLTH